jgi:hypothetical protein
MKIRQYFIVQDFSGNVVDGAAVSVFLSGQNTPARVYTSRTDNVGTTVTPQVRSGVDGSVEFWVDTNDVVNGQLFDIRIEKDRFSLQATGVSLIEWAYFQPVRAEEIIPWSVVFGG